MNAYQLLCQSIMTLMAKIEDERKSIFTDIDGQFEDEIFEAIDSKNKARLNGVIKRLEAML